MTRPKVGDKWNGRDEFCAELQAYSQLLHPFVLRQIPSKDDINLRMQLDSGVPNELELIMPTTKREKDACDLLDSDHKAVKAMFKEYD